LSKLGRPVLKFCASAGDAASSATAIADAVRIFIGNLLNEADLQNHIEKVGCPVPNGKRPGHAGRTCRAAAFDPGALAAQTADVTF
jgi:hypothetical protein